MKYLHRIRRKIINEDQFLKARQTLLKNMHDVHPYYRGLNCKQEIDRIGFIFIDGRIEPYMYLSWTNGKYLIGSNDLSEVEAEDAIDWDKQHMTWINLLKYKKYDINFNYISNFAFIIKKIKKLFKKYYN